MVRKASLYRDPMFEKVSGTVREKGLFLPGDTVVVAVSGGADSVALLDLLSLMTDLRLTLVAAHLNHCLRGKESDDDAGFVAGLASRYGIPCEVKRVDVEEIARLRKLSLEEAGRIARYEWFDRIARSRHARRVALGHHADDQAETFLQRLFRGSGTTGLSGMRFLSSDRYVRPFLAVTREEILAYLERRGLSYRHDSSNNNTVFLRNRIRHECLPYLKTFNPAIVERLNTTADILAADEAVLEMITDKVFPRLSRVGSGCIDLDAREVRKELPGLRYRVYRRALKIARGDLARITVTHLKGIDDLVHSSRSQGGCDLPCGLRVRRCYETLRFIIPAEEREDPSWELLIEGPGTYRLGDGTPVIVRLTAPPEDFAAAPGFRAYFDLRKTPFPWMARTFRNGDRFRPFGMSGRKKLKDFFIDQKIPASLRRRIPLLFSGEELIWVCSLRVSESGRISPGIREVAEVEIPGFTPYSSCKTEGRMVFHQ